MSAYGREAAAWVEGSVLGRDAAAWTDPTDAGFAWDGTQWVAFQPIAGELAPPENLAATPTSISVLLGWTDPTPASPAVTPSHVQVRLPQVTPVWTEYTYGDTDASIANLDPATEYQAQVRYVKRSDVDGTVALTSVPATVFFTTDAADAPSAPAPDPGGTGPDSIITWPPQPTGSGPNTWEYIVQIPDDPASVAFTWVDTAVTGTVAHSDDIIEDNVDFVAAGLACGGLARFKYREMIDGFLPLDYQFSQAFVLPCDWATRCAGTTVGAAWGSAPWDTAISAVPQACMSAIGGGFQIEDYITEVEFGRLEAYVGAGLDAQGDWFVQSRSTASASGDPILAGFVAALEGQIPVSFNIALKVSAQPPNDLAGGQRVAVIGERITMRIYEQGAGYRARFTWPNTGGGADFVETAELALDVVNTITLTMPSFGATSVYANGVFVDNALSAPDLVAMTRDLALYAGPTQELGRIGLWDRELSALEVAALVPSTFTALAIADSASRTPVGPISVDVGDRLLVCSVYRDSTTYGTVKGQTPTVSGGAIMVAVADPHTTFRFDTSGVSDGAVGLSEFVCTAAGTITGITSVGDVRSSAVVIPGSTAAVGRITASTSESTSGIRTVTPGPAELQNSSMIIFAGGGGGHTGGTDVETIGRAAINTVSEPDGFLDEAGIYAVESGYSGFCCAFAIDEYTTNVQTIEYALTNNPSTLASGGAFMIAVEVVNGDGEAVNSDLVHKFDWSKLQWNSSSSKWIARDQIGGTSIMLPNTTSFATFVGPDGRTYRHTSGSNTLFEGLGGFTATPAVSATGLCTAVVLFRQLVTGSANSRVFSYGSGIRFVEFNGATVSGGVVNHSLIVRNIDNTVSDFQIAVGSDYMTGSGDYILAFLIYGTGRGLELRDFDGVLNTATSIVDPGSSTELDMNSQGGGSNNQVLRSWHYNRELTLGEMAAIRTALEAEGFTFGGLT